MALTGFLVRVCAYRPPQRLVGSCVYTSVVVICRCPNARDLPLIAVPAWVDIGTWVGVTACCSALILAISGIRELRRAETPVSPCEPTSAIVRTGPYRVSRNPLYVALSFLQVGVGLWLENVWIVAMLIPALVVMWWGVVAREEQYLAQKFGQDYLDYISSVHGWL